MKIFILKHFIFSSELKLWKKLQQKKWPIIFYILVQYIFIVSLSTVV